MDPARQEPTSDDDLSRVARAFEALTTEAADGTAPTLARPVGSGRFSDPGRELSAVRAQLDQLYAEATRSREHAQATDVQVQTALDGHALALEAQQDESLHSRDRLEEEHRLITAELRHRLDRLDATLVRVQSDQADEREVLYARIEELAAIVERQGAELARQHDVPAAKPAKRSRPLQG